MKCGRCHHIVDLDTYVFWNTQHSEHYPMCIACSGGWWDSNTYKITRNHSLDAEFRYKMFVMWTKGDLE